MTALVHDDLPAIVATDLTVEVDRRRLLDRLSLSVQPGEWLNVVGPNGAGKTTLLRVLAGLAAADGELTIDGRDARALRRRDRSKLVALVPQSPLVPAGMTVTEYVLLGRTAHIHPLASESRHDLHEVARALDRLDLGPFADRTVDTLSGGELQRVLVARLLAQDAPIALLVISVSLYYGYNVRGGPVEVGIATARSMTVNLVLATLANMALTLVFWGIDPHIPVA